MIWLVFIGLYFAVILNLSEAKIDSLERLPSGEKYDYNKKKEPFFSFCLYSFYPILISIHLEDFSNLKLVFIWFGVRGFFDYMVNYYYGFHWSYLGSTAKTDLMLKRFNPIILLVGRLLILVGTIYLSML